MENIHKDIQKFGMIGSMTIDYLASEYGEDTITKKERYEFVIHMCDLYLEGMEQILLAAGQEAKDADDQSVIRKCEITVEQGASFINALKELRQAALSFN